MLKERVITAVILAPIVVGLIFLLPTALLAVLLGVIIVLGAREWARFFQWPDDFSKIFILAVAGLLVVGYALSFMSIVVNALLWMVSIAWIGAFFWILRVRIPVDRGVETVNEVALFPIKKNVAAVLGGGILIPCFVALLYLHGNDRYGPGFLLFCLTVMWVADIGAYFSGKRWGKTKLAPSVSPGKTWEGVAGALVLTAIWAVLGAYMLDLDKNQFGYFVVICVVTAGFSVVGDLFESLFKRLAKVKDSGQLLPGHGGVLDRIDSITAGAPVFVLGLNMMV
ncbi:MAG: phosphatidate cytidylyltransferase [Gammaproteobacteria bacterium]|nr:phosphatidate cytidylyltransferase [Gammaproteobacteria bacterium]